MNKTRNVKEKKRRDKEKYYITELETLVSESRGNKMDQVTVLETTVSHIKQLNEMSKQSQSDEISDWKPKFLTTEEFAHLMLEAINGFILVLGTDGHILYTSESLASLLGYLPSSLHNTTLYEIVADGDKIQLYNTLNISHNSETSNQHQIKLLINIRRSNVHPVGEDEEVTEQIFERVELSGYFRKWVDPTEPVENCASDDDKLSLKSCMSLSNTPSFRLPPTEKIVFVATGRLVMPQLIPELPVVHSSQSEFVSRHSLEWIFLSVDHRATPIIGYANYDLLGKSGYDYYHTDDLDQVAACHEALKQTGECTPCTYRFLTKGHQYIWLQTRYVIKFDQGRQEEFIEANNKVINLNDVPNQHEASGSLKTRSTKQRKSDMAKLIKKDGVASLSPEASPSSSSLGSGSCSASLSAASDLSRDGSSASGADKSCASYKEMLGSHALTPVSEIPKIYEEIQGRGNLGNSATFQRLGMKTSQQGIPSLEVSHLETKPLSPVDIEENIEDDIHKTELKRTREGEETKKFQRVKKILSPTSAEVLARRDSVRSKVGSQRLSRKTLKFQSPNDISHVNVSTDGDPSVLLSVPQEARRSGRSRVELGNDSVSWSRVSGGVSSKSEDEEVARTVVKKPRDQNPRMERKDKDLQHLSHISEKPSEVSVDASAHGLYNRNVQGFDNPGYESQSVHSDNCRVRESVISPPRRSSVIREPGSQGSSQGASVISPTHKASPSSSSLGSGSCSASLSAASDLSRDGSSASGAASYKEMLGSHALTPVYEIPSVYEEIMDEKDVEDSSLFKS